ncbi:RluA family pseudouridine synthase [Streptomyces sp. NPDC002640]
MPRRTSAPSSPLPQRDGVDAVRIRLPAGGPGTTVGEHLRARLAADPALLDAMFAAGEIVGADGRPVDPATPYRAGLCVWFHRDLPDEERVPFPVGIVYRDEHVVVADKPHFLATTPRGSHVAETALARLRRDLSIPTLTAAHRLDRHTAGLVLFTVRPEERGAYQSLFRDRHVTKEYEAIAPFDPALELPREVRSRMVKERGSLTAREVEGEPNAVSRVELLERRGGLARYRLLPRTGQTHQLRVHLCSLGVPILGDPLYPEVLPPAAPGDFSRPLQLLARALSFTDPVTGVRHAFRSGRELEGFPS